MVDGEVHAIDDGLAEVGDDARWVVDGHRLRGHLDDAELLDRGLAESARQKAVGAAVVQEEWRRGVVGDVGNDKVWREGHILVVAVEADGAVDAPLPIEKAGARAPSPGVAAARPASTTVRTCTSAARSAPRDAAAGHSVPAAPPTRGAVDAPLAIKKAGARSTSSFFALFAFFALLACTLPSDAGVAPPTGFSRTVALSNDELDESSSSGLRGRRRGVTRPCAVALHLVHAPNFEVENCAPPLPQMSRLLGEAGPHESRGLGPSAAEGVARTRSTACRPPLVRASSSASRRVGELFRGNFTPGAERVEMTRHA